MERGDEKLLSNKWVSGCLYADPEGHFLPGRKAGDSAVILAFLVNAAGALYVSCVVLLRGFCYLPFIPRSMSCLTWTCRFT